MGYKEGAGLGKKGKGRVDIVEASKQRGRRGLGLKTAGFEPSTEVVWAGDEKVCSICVMITCLTGTRSMRGQHTTYTCSTSTITQQSLYLNSRLNFNP